MEVSDDVGEVESFVFDLDGDGFEDNLEDDEGILEDDEDGNDELHERSEDDEDELTGATGCSDDDAEVQPDFQFERVDYEGLAARKRRAIAREDSLDASSVRQDESGVSQEELMEVLNFGKRRRKRPREKNKRGRQKGSKNRRNPEITKLLGDATILYVHGHHQEAIHKLHDVIKLSGDVPEAYHMLALIHDTIGNTKTATEFYTIVASLTRRDSSIWKLLFSQHMSDGNIERAIKCLSKAVMADPRDIKSRVRLALIYEDHEDHQKAAKSYEQIARSFPESMESVEALMRAAELYLHCGQIEQSVSILEDYINFSPCEVDFSIVNSLASILMDTKSYDQALKHIDQAHSTCQSEKALPPQLTVKSGICYLYLGEIENAEMRFSFLKDDNISDHIGLIIEVADAYMDLKHFQFGLKYYHMLEPIATDIEGFVSMKIAKCYLFLEDRMKAFIYLNKALEKVEDYVDARLTLASLMVEDGREDEAICLLSPPSNSESIEGNSRPWWNDGKIKLRLGHIYKDKGMTKEFVDTIYPIVRESLYIENVRPKVKVKKRLTESVLRERSKILDIEENDDVFGGLRPLASQSELLKARRARKLLKKKEEQKDYEYISDFENSDEEFSTEFSRCPPLPDFLKNEEHLDIILALCKALKLLGMYWEALEIIDLTRRLAYKSMPPVKKEELQSLAAQISYCATDPKHGFECVRTVLLQHPRSYAAWNNYYKITLRLGKNYQRHAKFLRHMRAKHSKCVPPILISGHQFTTASHHQDAAREYLEAYKLCPESPLINLCAGTSLINLALGFRLQNKHQSVVQGLAFLFNNLRIAENKQESLYNIARAYHHVGLVTLAVVYYEKVLAIQQEDFPIPKLLNENSDDPESLEAGHCDLKREAAYNLHLIYKHSGAFDLARQVLKEHCRV